jgi:hypothetical protein
MMVYRMLKYLKVGNGLMSFYPEFEGLDYCKLKFIFPGTTDKICRLLQLKVVCGGEQS